MLKKRITTVLVAVALLISVTAGSGIVADAFGLELTPSVQACSGSGGGGGC